MEKRKNKEEYIGKENKKTAPAGKRIGNKLLCNFANDRYEVTV
ncbi:hypothetical protein [Ectobacillus funiculus]|uniref:Uncharacterized protein n=1 Tax=Ectobacillus funiculus TaxID=137993 RepID=A0ABV5WG41_9BACI